VLFAQPTRAFHGINLQDGSNIIAFFVHWWNLEEYQQSFERIARHARRRRITTGRFLFITSSRPTPPTNWLWHAANQKGM
jgi:hypothetical protein